MSLYRSRRPSSAPRVVMLALIGLLLGLGVAAIFFGLPRVVAVSPEGSASSRNPITITFSQPMDQASVESRLTIEPEVSGRVEWSANNSLLFTPQGEWTSGTVRVTLASGARSERGLPSLFAHSWAFTISAPGVAFLLKTNEAANVWVTSLDGNQTQVTTEPLGVEDFAVSPDGTQIAYAALRADGGADLKRVDRDGSNIADLLLCPNLRCSAPVFSPDGRRLAFEQWPLDSETATLTKVMVLDLATGEAVNPAKVSLHLTQSPRFAPDGRLSYLDKTEQAIAVYTFGSFTSYIPNSSGEVGAWTPDSQTIIFPEIFFLPEPTPGGAEESLEQFYSHLIRVTVSSNATQNLSGDELVEDASPSVSPSGAWVAFARKQLSEDKWTPGRQLWLMRPDGSEAQQLTDAPEFNHSAFAWSPDSRQIVYMRFDVTDPGSPAELWIVDADGSEARLLAQGGYLPEWLP